MNTQSTTKQARAFVFAALLITVAVLCLNPSAFAKLAANTINAQAVVSNNGRHLIVTGPLRTDLVQPILMHITVTQRSTGAIAEGIATFTGTASDQQWEVHVWTTSLVAFEEGPATAVALARTFNQGRADDSHQWLVNITLVRQ